MPGASGRRAAWSRVEGIWRGALEVDDAEVVLILRIRRDPQGQPQATLDSPYQEVRGIPASRVDFRGDRLRVEFAAVKGRFEGAMEHGDRALDGSWRQMGSSFAIRLVRLDAEPVLRRPQEPRRPFPYREEEAEYETAGAVVKLAGTLTRPDSPGPFPAMVLVSGSGPLDRDESMFGHKPFLVLADYLSRRGIAVLRPDSRGVGGSSGDLWGATARDLTDDVLAGVDYLKGRGEIDPTRIGLLGHSEGAALAAMAASRRGDVAFLVMLAGPVALGAEVIARQVELIATAESKDPADIDEWREANRTVYRILREEPDQAAAEAKIRDVLAPFIAASPDRPGKAAKIIEDSYKKVLFSTWFRSFLESDPGAALRRVACPVLAINGEKDLQVDPRQNLPLIEDALREGGNPDFTIRELPGLNHLFQHCRTGSPAEYPRIEETLAPEVLELIAAWVVERVTGPTEGPSDRGPGPARS